MIGVDFRVFPAGNQWNWQILGPSSEVREQGLVNTKAEAAAFVIRATVSTMIEVLDLRSERQAA